MFKRVLCVTLCFVWVLVSGCISAVSEEEIDQPFIPKEAKGSVSFIDVGAGECTFIIFPDGKNMLIDCGSDQEKSKAKIKNYLKDLGVSKIDWLVLTHPDVEHVGGLQAIIQEFCIGKAFVPDINQDKKTIFGTYFNAIDKLKDKQVEIDNTLYNTLAGEGYSVAFLSPQISGSIDEFNITANPSAEQTDNLCPIIYVEINGVRFLLNGDVKSSEEQAVLNNYLTGFYDLYFSYYGVNVNLENIDFYKFSDGASGYPNLELLRLLCPLNAVLFTGEGKIVQSSIINTVYEVNPEYKLYRTDYFGNMAVIINGINDFRVKIQRER